MRDNPIGKECNTAENTHRFIMIGKAILHIIIFSALSLFLVSAKRQQQLPSRDEVLANAQFIAATRSYNERRTGANLQETILNTENVNPTQFGKLFERQVQGAVYAQPLYVGNLNLTSAGRGVHNVLFVATMANFVYAFDADDPSQTLPLWTVQLGPPVQISDNIIGGRNYSNIHKVVGILSTPVIDHHTGLMYVIALNDDSMDTSPPEIRYNFRLWAIDILSGSIVLGPHVISTFYPGSGYTLVGNSPQVIFNDTQFKIGENTTVRINPDIPSLINATIGPIPATFPNRTNTGAIDFTFVADERLNFDGPSHVNGTFIDFDTDARGTVFFNVYRQAQRVALTLAGDYIFAGFGSYHDLDPYHGWLIGFNKTTLRQAKVWNSSPNGFRDAIWMSGQGISVDEDGFLYLTTGNGACLPYSGSYCNAVVKLAPFENCETATLRVIDYFLPSDFRELNIADWDLGSTGVVLVPDLDRAVGGTKGGVLYVLNMRNLTEGPFTPRDGNAQTFQVGEPHIYGTPVIWKSSTNSSSAFVYVWPGESHLRQFNLIASPGGAGVTLDFIANSTEVVTNEFGGFLSLSANDNIDASGILWAVHSVGNPGNAIQPGVLHAYRADDISVELWNSTIDSSRDEVGPFAKFNIATVANGLVYLPTEYLDMNPHSPDLTARINIYGLFIPRVVRISKNILNDDLTLLTTTAVGASPMHYQWFGRRIDTGEMVNLTCDDANSRSLLVTEDLRDMFSEFLVLVSNSSGQTRSSPVRI